MLACSLALDAKITDGVNVGECAKCFASGRIGEAANPGPRQGQWDRAQQLESLKFVEPKILAIQDRAWKALVTWLQDATAPAAALSAMACPLLLSSLLAEFGSVLYSKVASLYLYRQAVHGCCVEDG